MGVPPPNLDVWNILRGLNMGGGVYMGGESEPPNWRFEHERLIGSGRGLGFRGGVEGGFLNTTLSRLPGCSDFIETSASLSSPSWAMCSEAGDGGGGQWRFAWCSVVVTISWGRFSSLDDGMWIFSSTGRSRLMLWSDTIMLGGSCIVAGLLPIECGDIPLSSTVI
jgi:hypothetical protein